MPDMTVIVVCFLALRRDPVSLTVVATFLGYLAGRQALAPSGLHETALIFTALGVYFAAGSLAGGGGLFFAFASGVAVMCYHALLFVLIYWQRGMAGFASWATAMLVPDGLATCFVALLCYLPMCWLDRRLTQDKREGLAWH